MRWFEHDSKLRNEDCFQQMNAMYGTPLGYAFGLIIWEVVAQHGGDEFRMPLSRQGCTFNSLDYWARQFGGAEHPTTKKLAAQILMGAALCGVIDDDALNRDGVVYAPALRDHLDQWARKKAKRSAVASDSEK